MIVDASAIISILRAEDDAPRHAGALATGLPKRMSAANYLEAAIVVDAARDPIANQRFDDLLQRAGIVIEPVTVEQARVARSAYRRFGRGSKHPAKLNFGDCFAYALAKAYGEPLLFKGDDFGLTDLTPYPIN